MYIVVRLQQIQVLLWGTFWNFLLLIFFHPQLVEYLDAEPAHIKANCTLCWGRKG